MTTQTVSTRPASTPARVTVAAEIAGDYDAWRDQLAAAGRPVTVDDNVVDLYTHAVALRSALGLLLDEEERPGACSTRTRGEPGDE